MSRSLHGVNLGGWLVLEPWITPQLFEGTNAIDEYSLNQRITAAGRQKLRAHYETFITEDDFIWLAQQGVQAVRLPIGYWLFGSEEPYQKTVQYVDKVFVWAKRYHLKVLLSVHGAPGSQNGQAHSGRAGAVNWNQPATLACIDKLAWHYCEQPALLGIAVLNEPAPEIATDQLEKFYHEAYHLIRKYCGTRTWVVCSDGFRPRDWYGRLPANKYPGLYIDYHHYQLSGAHNEFSPAWWQILRAWIGLPFTVRRMARHHPLVVGEWSLALPAAKISKLPRWRYRVLMQRYGRVQLRAFQPAAAEFFWTYKTESSIPWDFSQARKRHWLSRR